MEDKEGWRIYSNGSGLILKKCRNDKAEYEIKVVDNKYKVKIDDKDCTGSLLSELMRDIVEVSAKTFSR